MNKHSPIVSEFESEEQELSYLRWLEAKVARSRANPHPGIPHETVMAEMRDLLASKPQ